jgi:hypothetical protein
MYKRHRGWKRKQRRRPWYVYAAPLIGIPIGLELLARLMVGVTGFNQAFTDQPSEQEKRIEAYQLGFLSPDGKAYEDLPQQGKLQAVRSPLMGYQLLPEQKSDYWTINPQGFRDDEPVPLDKSANELRIFVLGGSMAFGQMSSNNQATLASQLETLLNNQVKEQQANPSRFQPAILPYTADEVAKVLQRPPRIPERQYRVVNAAVPGYASGNDLAMLTQQVSAYNPDVLILLNSYEDLLLPSNYSGVDVPGLDDLIAGKRETMGSQVGETLKGWFNQLYLVQGVQHYILQASQTEEAKAIPLNIVTAGDKPALTEALAADDAELDARVNRYRNHVLQMVRWSAASRKRLLVGIQPELSSRPIEQMPPPEQAMLEELGDNYSQRMQANYTKLVAAAKQATQSSANAKLLDLHNLYANSKDAVFQTPTSLTDSAYTVLADQFYQTLAAQLAIEPKPYGAE